MFTKCANLAIFVLICLRSCGCDFLCGFWHVTSNWRYIDTNRKLTEIKTMKTILKFNENTTEPNLSIVDSEREASVASRENISYLGVHKDEFSLVKDEVNRGQLQEKVEMLVTDYLQDNMDLTLVMEIAVTYEMLGKLSFAYCYYFWAHELSGKDESLARKLEYLRDQRPELVS